MTPLPDYIQPGLRVLLVGINPGLRSAQVGHHFAGHSNRFWKLLYESHLITEPLKFQDDWRLPEWGLGITNMVPRPTAGCSELSSEEYHVACVNLIKKVEQFQPPILALLGVTLGRCITARCHEAKPGQPSKQIPTKVGQQSFHIGKAQVFVLPNPSRRNAHYPYQEMLGLFQELQRLRHQTGFQSAQKFPEPPRPISTRTNIHF